MLIRVGHIQRGLHHIVGKVVVKHHRELVLVKDVGHQSPANVRFSHSNALVENFPFLEKEKRAKV